MNDRLRLGAYARNTIAELLDNANLSGVAEVLCETDFVFVSEDAFDMTYATATFDPPAIHFTAEVLKHGFAFFAAVAAHEAWHLYEGDEGELDRAAEAFHAGQFKEARKLLWRYEYRADKAAFAVLEELEKLNRPELLAGIRRARRRFRATAPVCNGNLFWYVPKQRGRKGTEAVDEWINNNVRHLMERGKEREAGKLYNSFVRAMNKRGFEDLKLVTLEIEI